MIFKNIWKRKYLKLKEEYNKLKENYEILRKNYEKLYSYLNSTSFFRNNLRKYILHNSPNIKNFNYKDTLYNSRKYVCLDGQIVRSKTEREIYNYLILNGVKVKYEAPFYFNGKIIFRPDFYLPEYKLYIEYFGRNYGEDPKYDDTRNFKTLWYSLKNSRVIFIEPPDEYNLYHNIKRKLSFYINTKHWL